MAVVTHETLDGGIARVAIDRPDKRNAMSPEARNELIEAVARALDDQAVTAILLGSNQGHFCAGGDVGSMDVTDPRGARRRMQRTHRLVHLLLESDKPVVAAIEGYAVGAGASIAMLADTIVIARGGAIGFPFFHIGLVPDCGLLHTLPRRVGPARARQLLLYGSRVMAEDAVAMGLADVLAEDGEAEDRALERIAELTAMPPHAFALAKRQLALFPTSLDQALEMESMAQSLAFGGTEFAEGRAAFREKRKPRFQ